MEGAIFSCMLQRSGLSSMGRRRQDISPRNRSVGMIALRTRFGSLETRKRCFGMELIADVLRRLFWMGRETRSSLTTLEGSRLVGWLLCICSFLGLEMPVTDSGCRIYLISFPSKISLTTHIFSIIQAFYTGLGVEIREKRKGECGYFDKKSSCRGVDLESS